MASPTISVVIPAYNHEKFIGPAIQAVLEQTIQDFEIVIVDDGSTDKTADVIKSFDDSRISYTWQENQDAFNTINRGMSLARGKYISILNSDDIYTQDRLEKLLVHCQQHHSACVFSDVIPISDDGEEFVDPSFGWNVWHQKNRQFYRQKNDIYRGFLHGNFMVTTSNLFMTREAVEKVGEFSPIRYLHDYDYIFRMMLANPGSVHYLENDKLLYYRIHEGNTLSEAAITGREQDLDVIEKYMLAKLPEESQEYALTGANRLRQLEREINEVRQQLAQSTQNNDQPQGVTNIIRRIRNKICRTFCPGH